MKHCTWNYFPTIKKIANKIIAKRERRLKFALKITENSKYMEEKIYYMKMKV